MATAIASKTLVTSEHVAQVKRLDGTRTPRKQIAADVGLSLKTVGRILSGENMVGKISSVPTRRGKTYCEVCHQWHNGDRCKRCERDRKLGAKARRRYRLDKHLSSEERAASSPQQRQLERELPEAVKLPPITKWDNIEPVHPHDLVDHIAMIVNCDEVRELDDFDQRWTLSEGGEL
ncbi:hypothetical protein [Aeoliella sp.]|uniref:hypothetical protein n=1 Tax=Aeoliella sp. TaxID=2795800 RepID=UPI003CCC455C